MKNANGISKNRSLEKLIKEFCSIILTEGDQINNDAGKNFIIKLNSEERERLNKAKEDDYKSTVQSSVIEYLQKYQSRGNRSKQVGTPFEFDSGDTYNEYVKNFKNLYLNEYKKRIPAVFDYIFNYINDVSEHYRIFEQFYLIRYNETHERVLQNTENIAKRAVEQIRENEIQKTQNSINKILDDTKIVIYQAEEAAKQSESEAKKAADNAKEAVEKEVKEKMLEVTKNVSETSVTILGIFAGIVLTVVAGLFYSSSVLESVNGANFFKLMSVSSFVGFVCFNLIALMFQYVERIRNIEKINEDENKKKRMAYFKGVTSSVSIILILVMVASGFFYFKCPDMITEQNQNKPSVNLSADVFIEPPTTNFPNKNEETTENITKDNEEITENITGNNEETTSTTE